MTNMTNVEKLDKLLAEEKEKHGLIGWSISLGNKIGTIEEIAGDCVKMHQALLDGNYKDITGEVL